MTPSLHATPLPPSDLPYPTAGNWEITSSGDIVASCASLPDMDESVALVMIHELVEAFICKCNGISEESVTAFDTSHLELNEPGDSPEAPYHSAHFTSMQVEKMICSSIGLSWHKHEENVSKIADAVDNALRCKTNHP